MKTLLNPLSPLIALILMLLIQDAKSQDVKPASYLDLGAGFFQLKDGKNYGLVFNGGMVNTSYSLRIHPRNQLLNYRVDFGFGPSFAKGIAGMNFKLNPINIDYCFRIAGNDSYRLYLGPYAGMNYQFQLYPELQSGHMLWFTFYDVGPRLILDADVSGQVFHVSFSTAVGGLVSRPVEMNEEYYYSLALADIIRNLHSNFTAGSLDIMSHIDFEAEWKIPESVKSYLTYRLEYMQYSPNASLDYLSHTISYRMKLGTKNKRHE
jgi:hypothetical protein